MLGPPASLWEVGFPRLRQDYQKPGDPAWNSPDLCAPDEVHTAGLGRGPGRVDPRGTAQRSHSCPGLLPPEWAAALRQVGEGGACCLVSLRF